MQYGWQGELSWGWDGMQVGDLWHDVGVEGHGAIPGFLHAGGRLGRIGKNLAASYRHEVVFEIL